MIVLRRRLVIWLLKAYIKKWGKNIILYFGIGLLVFFFLNMFLSYFVTRLPFVEKETIGMVGPFTTNDLPHEIISKIARGLTKAEKDGSIVPDIAKRWQIAPNGKGYAFYLDENARFSDGSKIEAEDISYGFKDVSISRPNGHTIVFNLKDSYSPFLTTVTRPIFKKGFVGAGDYKIKKIKLNGDFVETVELYSDKYKKAYIYQLFYPTFASLKTAFALGEVSKIVKLPDVSFKDTSFESFGNAKVEKKVNYTKMAALFFNTRDSVLSSKQLREGLWYSMPDMFEQGERNASPIPQFSYALHKGANTYQQDLLHALELVEKSGSATGSGTLTLTIDTLPKYESSAKEIAEIWRQLNVQTKIRLTDQVPSNFQIFLGEFNVSSDPDQYTLWHSDQVSNVTHYNNKRIDKLLEDGRNEHDIEKRTSIYTDFVKYMFQDPPAAFLFFPYYYDVSKK